jgi:hypothetical protein
MNYQYPTTPRSSFPYEIENVYSTIISSFDSGKEQRRLKNLYPKYNVSLKYDILYTAEFQILWNFYQARKGTLEAFMFYTPDKCIWENNFVGMGNASSITFDIPGKTTQDHLVYLNGLVQDSNDYAITYGLGDCSSDIITFDTAPALNDIITIDFNGYLRIRCRFAEQMTRSAMIGLIYSAGIKLKGLSTI